LTARSDLVVDVLEAATRHGMFALRQPYVSPEVAGRCFREAGRFFARSLNEKKRLVGSSLTSIGFSTREEGSYRSGNARGGYLNEMIDVGPPAKEPPYFDAGAFPADMSEFVAAARRYYLAANKLERIVATLFSLALERLTGRALGSDYLTNMIAPHRALLRKNHYPAVASRAVADPAGAANERNGAHVDWTPFTLLMPDGPGLASFCADRWTYVPFGPFLMLVLVGEQLARLSNGAFRGALHRVPAANGQLAERISLAYFVSEHVVPGEEMLWVPLAGPGQAAQFEPMTVREFLVGKFGALKSTESSAETES
jgi:isopenicillin N synthase-like dioxygenase